MYEREIQTRFDTFLKKEKIQFFSKNIRTPNSCPDRVILLNDKVVCIEVKGDGFSRHVLIGEIMNYFADFSHICVVTDKRNYDNIKNLLDKTSVFLDLYQKIGMIVLDNETKEFKILKEPSNSVYYSPVKSRKIMKELYNSKMPLDFLTSKILQQQMFTIGQLSQAMINFKFYVHNETLRKRCKRLEELGYLSIINYGNPQTFVRTDKEIDFKE